MRKLTFALALLVVAGSTAYADTQPLDNAEASVEDGSAVWKPNPSAAAITFIGPSMVIGHDFKSTSFSGILQYHQLPGPGAGILVKLATANGAEIGRIYFGGLHQDCHNEDVHRIAVAEKSTFDFSMVNRVKKAGLTFEVGPNNWTKCPG
jgi:hypothetical protein